MTSKLQIIQARTSGGKSINDALSVKIKDAILKKGLTEAQARQALETRRQQILTMGMNYWRGTLGAIATTLENPGMANFKTGGHVSKYISVPVGKRPSGGTAVRTTLGSGSSSWLPLNKKYAEGKPPFPGPTSTTYWKKTGALATDFRNKAMDYGRLNALGNYGRQSLKLTPGTKTLAKMQMRIDFPSVGGPKEVDRLVRASFANGRPVLSSLSKEFNYVAFRKTGIGHLILAEEGYANARPWVAAFAATMGYNYQMDLKALAARKP